MLANISEFHTPNILFYHMFVLCVNWQDVLCLTLALVSSLVSHSYHMHILDLSVYFSGILLNRKFPEVSYYLLWHTTTANLVENSNFDIMSAKA